jgi:hypothetical protein
LENRALLPVREYAWVTCPSHFSNALWYPPQNWKFKSFKTLEFIIAVSASRPARDLQEGVLDIVGGMVIIHAVNGGFTIFVLSINNIAPT